MVNLTFLVNQLIVLQAGQRWAILSLSVTVTELVASHVISQVNIVFIEGTLMFGEVKCMILLPTTTMLTASPT
jgi:hypothetical protein